MSKTRSIHHIVFATKGRMPAINKHFKRELYLYIHGIIKNLNCTLLRMNGTTDHIHILVDLHPSVSLSLLVQKIKQSSSMWLKANPHFSLFDAWGEGYFAESVGRDDVEACRQYIINQETHHSIYGLSDELRSFASRLELEYHDNDLR